METTMVYWGYIEVILGLYRGYILKYPKPLAAEH